MRLITRGFLTLLAFVAGISGSTLKTQQLLEETKLSVVEADENYRLNDDVLPSNYKIRLEPFFEDEGVNQKFTFKGRVEITLKATKPDVKFITLHHYNLDIESYGFNTNEPDMLYNNTTYNATYDKWTIPIPQTLNNGVLSNETDTILIVDYIGYMGDDMRGFYKSYYIEKKEKVWIGTTQFQPGHARRAFPCFDEPGFKATFDLTIIRPSSHSLSISNTKIKSIAPSNGKYVDIFNTTPKMSTYLLAFMVTNYNGSLKNTDNFGVYARPEAQALTTYALEIGIEMLKILNAYLDIDYYSTMDKMDMAAIPDFSAGAMENWGLLTYRETNILYDNETSSRLNQQRIAAVIVHEQAHMWFGDLLTCKWWSETWLNEGFARYFQYMGTGMHYKDWDLEQQFVVEQIQQAMQLDSTDSTHPMTSPVNTKTDASAMFDNISYNKGASMLRWLFYYVGADKFQKILQHYLKAHKFEAVVPKDFFDAIENVTNAEAARFFSSWTERSGYPLVTASLNGTKLTLTQKRFMRSGGTNNTKTEKYNIPITISIDNEGFNNHSVVVMFNDSKTNIELELETEPTIYMLNVQQTGFYRVNYDNNNWNKIKEALKGDDMNKIHELNRAQVVDDLFHLARGGEVEYAQAIDIILYLKNEEHYIPWYAAINQGLTYLSQRVKSNDADIFKWFVNYLMENIYNKLTFSEIANDTRIDIYNRVNILTWLCKYGHEDCISKAKETFDKYLNSGEKVPRDYRQVVYCSAVRNGGDKEFDFLYDLYLDQNVAFEQLNINNALGCSKDEKNIKKYLDRLIETDEIRPQDRASAINSVLNSNPEGVDYLFNFINENYEDWKEKMGDLSTLTTVVGRFTTTAQLEKFRTFLEDKKTDLGDLHTSLSNAIATVQANFDWDNQYMTSFIKYLHEINSATIKLASVVLSVVTLISLYIFN